MRTLFIILFLLFFSQEVYTQGFPFLKKIKELNIDTVYSDSANRIIFLQRSNCKNYFRVVIDEPVVLIQSTQSKIQGPRNLVSLPKKSQISISGEIMYEYYYNERVDTPFSSKALHQHNEIVNLNVLIKDQYAFKVSFNSRQSNSNLFRNYVEPGIRFDKEPYIEKLRNKWIERWRSNIPGRDMAGLLQKRLDSIRQIEIGIAERLEAPRFSQQIISERENYLRVKAQRNNKEVKEPALPFALWKKKHVVSDTFLLDKNPSLSQSVSSSWLDSVNFETDGLPKTPTELLLDSLKKQQTGYKNETVRLVQIKDSLTKAIQAEELSLLNLSDPAQLSTDKLVNSGIDVSKEQRFLLNLKQVGIGRCNLNYSELTVRNISLLGLQLEYTPRKKYFAIAGGKVNYMFRDFLLSSANDNRRQEYYIVRFGTNPQKSTGAILSVFHGKRVMFSNTDNGGRFNGYSVELYKRVGKTDMVSVELAKTTPSIQLDSTKKSGVFDFKRVDNIAIAAKIHYTIPLTKTILEGAYRRVGYSFQSISLFTNNIDQKAWNIKAEQPLFNKTMRIVIGLRQNDFSTPLVKNNAQTTAVLKTIQVSFRKRKWPFFTAGYFPGSQLIKTDSGFVENIYYLTNVTGGYCYSVNKASMTTVANYNRFSSLSTDTGFARFEGYSFSINHDISFKKMSYHAMISVQKQMIIDYLTLETGANFFLNEFFSAGAQLKYNSVKNDKVYWGASGNININVKKVGSLQLMYDQMFLPDVKGQLSGADVGRLTFIKYL